VSIFDVEHHNLFSVLSSAAINTSSVSRQSDILVEASVVKYTLILVIVVAALIHLRPPAMLAQSVVPAQPAPPPFNPSFGDLMNTLVQPRHAKLALTAREQNWPLAAYAIHQLKDALANIAKWRPRFRNQSVPDMMEATTGEPIKAIEQAVQARDLRQFNEAFTRLTEGCNSCHEALNHGYIVIKAPDQSFFANQDFRVAK